MIGVFGSAFNPPSLGHKNVIMQAAMHCEKILLVPSASHAFGKRMLPYEMRFRMLVSFVQDICANSDDRAKLGKCVLEVSDIEQQMLLDGISPIYTFDVLERLENTGGPSPDQTTQYRFILGPDNANPDTWAKFYKHQEIDERWGKISCREQVNIRSTHIRQLAQTLPVDIEQLLQLTTPSVASIIVAEQIYLE